MPEKPPVSFSRHVMFRDAEIHFADDRRALNNAQRRFQAPLDHPHLPSPAPVWATVLRSFNITSLPAPEAIWGYWYPPAIMALGPAGDKLFRLRNYLCNWFWIRDAWFFCMSQAATAFAPFALQDWRDWLQQIPSDSSGENGGKDAAGSTMTAGRKKTAYTRFHAIFDPRQYVRPDFQRLRWYGKDYPSPPEGRILQQIGWELQEVSFRVELLYLDATLVKAPRECWVPFSSLRF